MSNLDTRKFINSIIRVIQNITMAELTNQGYKLVINYMNETADQDFSVCARYTIQKYTSKQVPTLDEIRQRHISTGITALDDLVLQMEYEAEALEKKREG